MKTLWLNVILLLVVAILAVVFTKLLWPTEKDIEERLEEIARTKALVDSLRMENVKLMAIVDSLNTERQTRQDEIKCLKERINHQQKTLQAAMEAIHVYEGTDDDLVNELNDILKSPLPALPD